MVAKRGRKSANEVIAAVTAPVAIESRLECPEHLNPDQEAVFRGVVDALPARFFVSDQAELLANYARHVVTARMLSAEIDRWRIDWFKSDDEGLKRFDQLLRMRDRETKAVNALARSLRLTNQSRIQPRGAGRAIDNSPTGKRPWEPI